MRKGWALLILATVMAGGTAADARELPLRFFTTADGLGDDRVKRIVSDSRGLLWVCTNSGISRFDGSDFQSFGLPDGLPFAIINDLLETGDGDFWLASNGGGVIHVRLSAGGQRYETFSVSARTDVESGQPAPSCQRRHGVGRHRWRLVQDVSLTEAAGVRACRVEGRAAGRKCPGLGVCE